MTFHTTESSERAHSRFDRVKSATKKFGRLAAGTALAFSGGAVGMNTYGQSNESIGPFKVSVGLKVGPGEGTDISDSFAGGTTVGLNDIRERFPTHSFGPRLSAELSDVNIPYFRNQDTPPTETFTNLASSDVERILADKNMIVARSLGSFVIGASLVSLLLAAAGSRKNENRNIRSFLHEAGYVGAATLVMAGSSGVGYEQAKHNPNAFLEPTKSSTVAEAEVMANSIGALRTLDKGALKNVTGFLSFVDLIQTEAERRSGIPEPSLTLLIKSDAHNRPDDDLIMAEEQRRSIDAVIDLGDETDFGSAEENSMITEPSNKPLYATPGNHDSPETSKTIDALPNTTVVGKGKIAHWDIDGLRVLAIGDIFYEPNDKVEDNDTDRNVVENIRQKIVAELDAADEAGEPYDMLFTHEPYLYENLDLKVSGTVSGHRHFYKFSPGENGPWNLQVGSIGGAGLRMLNGTAHDGEEGITPQQYNVLEMDSSCQLIRVINVSITTLGTEKKYSETTTVNDAYDPALSTDTRCGN